MTKRNRLHPRFDRMEDVCLLSGISSIAGYAVHTSYAGPFSIVSGPDGNLWFTELDAEKIGRINPTTGAVTEYPVPSTTSFGPYGIAAGSDGNLWFTQNFNNTIGKINPTTGAITEYTLPSATSETNGITAGPDGNLWFADPGTGSIGTINPTTGAITEYKVNIANAAPQSMATGPDGNLWFTDQGTRSIGKITTTGSVTEYALPSTTYPPSGITAGSDGNLWFGVKGTHSIGTINPATGSIAEFATPTTSSPQGITSGPDGNIWFTDQVAVAKIGEINPTTHVITEFPIPFAKSQPEMITTGPDGKLWFADNGANVIGAATLTTTQLVVTQSPPPSVIAGSTFSLTAQVQDNSGNLVSSFNGPVTISLANNPGAATLGGTLTVTASNGVATFSDLSLNKAASGYSLQVSASGIGGGVTGAIAVTPATATQVVISQQPPASVTAGSGFGLKAAIEDAYGNVETSATDTVNVAIANNPGGTSLGGTVSATASQGVATFSGLTLTKAASGYTLQVSDTGLAGSISTALTVNPASATKLVITQQPLASVAVNAGFGLTVAIEDRFGNVVTSASNTVKVALANNPTGAKLGGTLSVKASSGLATFSGLTLNKVGTGYTLGVSSSGLTGATSNAITVTAGAKAQIGHTAMGIGAVTPLSSTMAPDPALVAQVFDSTNLFEIGLTKKRLPGT